MNNALLGVIENVLQCLWIHTVNCSVKFQYESPHPTDKKVNSTYCHYNLQEGFDCASGSSIVVNHDYLRIVRLF